MGKGNLVLCSGEEQDEQSIRSSVETALNIKCVALKQETLMQIVDGAFVALDSLHLPLNPPFHVNLEGTE